MVGIFGKKWALKGFMGQVVCLVGGIVASVLILLWWGGCSVENNYEFLSKIFDGVPDPNAPEMFNGQSIAMSSTYSEHKPYTDEACFECHTDLSNMLLGMDDSSMCSGCHADVNEQYAYMHGAVTGNACLMCHNPHISALSNLLRENGPAMCLQCHEFDTESLIPSHSDLERSCTDCHSGHGGEVPFFLINQSSISETEREQAASESHQKGEGTDDP